MERFKLRMPTIQDVQAAWNCLPANERISKLHWETTWEIKDRNSNRNEFLLSDPCPDNPECRAWTGGLTYKGMEEPHFGGATEYFKLMFRPVLEAEEDMSCIRDGTVIRMGSFYVDGRQLPVPKADQAPPQYSPFREPSLALSCTGEGDNCISWIKCGNILMADRTLIDNMSYNDLKALGIADGVKQLMPFDETVSKYFYEQAMRQPDSPQRHVGDIMRDLALKLNDPEVSSSILYHFALSVHACWANDDEMDLWEIVHSTADFLQNGIKGFYWKEDDGTERYQDFSPAVVQNVLFTCNQDLFDHFIKMRSEDGVISVLSYSDGTPTTHAEALKCLQTMDHAIKEKEKKWPLTNMIRSAEERQATGTEAIGARQAEPER